MRTILRKVGNSCAVIIPKPFLAQLGAKVDDELELSLDKSRIVLSCVKKQARAGWAEAAQKIAQSGNDALVWPDFSNADDENLQW